MIMQGITVEVNERILIYAERYALGRRTYLVSDVCEAISTCMDKMSQSAKQCIAKDIRDAKEMNNLGDKCDEVSWMLLLNELESSTK